MRELFKTITFFLASCLIVVSVNAQWPNLKFQYLTSDHGLSSNRVTVVYRDSKDYVWIGTDDGLNKYDGHKIEVYRNQPNNPKSISNNQINCITEDNQGNIIVGTNDGLNIYNRNDASFTWYKNNPLNEKSISNSFVNFVYVDKQNNLWIGVNGKEPLNQWLPHSKTFTRYQTLPGQNNQFSSITAIAQDYNGDIWLSGQTDLLIRFEPGKGRFTDYNKGLYNLPGSVKRLLIDNQNTIWIATLNSGLFSFNTSTRQFTRFNSLGNGKGTNKKLITGIIQEDNNHLLIAVDEGGINRYNLKTNTFEYFVYNSNNINGLNNNGVWNVYKDKEGILWVGTSGGGLNIYNPKSEKFNLIRHIPGEANSIPYNLIIGLYEDSKGLIWIGTNGGGVSIYNPKTGKFTNYKNIPSDPNSLQCNVIRHIIEDRNHNFWIGTWDGGLIKFNPSTQKFTNFLPESKPPFNISGRNAWHQIIDHNGFMWVNMFGAGVDVIDFNKGIIKRFKPDKNINGSLSHENLRFIYEDNHKNIWIGSDDGLNLYDSTTNSFKVLRIFPNNKVAAFIEDKDGNYWAGTSSGLVKLSPDLKILKIYDTAAGLSNNFICGIIEDNRNNLWISTNDGITRLNYKTDKIRNYGLSDGLQGKQFELYSFMKTKTGEMYFGGFNGLNSFHPDSIRDNNFLPNVYISEFFLYNKATKIDTKNSPLNKVIEETKELKLTRNQSVFSFGFIAINYTNPEKNQYAYKMEGYDKDWNYTSASRRYATYTNLDPGKYTFRVKASNNDGIWSEKQASIEITIVPPFWKTLWFRILVTVSFLFFILAFFIYREKRLINQKKRLERNVKERTAELEEANFLLKERQDEILQQNEEISQQNQEITTQKENLQDQKNKLETAYNELALYEQHLEDIVEKRTRELLEAKQKAEESDRLKTSFLTNMSHEIRTPLNAIVGFTDLLFTGNNDTEKQDLFKSIIHSNTETLLQLINDILDLSKIEAGQLEIALGDISISEVLSELREMFSRELGKNDEKSLDFRVIIDAKLHDYIVKTDKLRLMQILQNLINNAIKFTHLGFVEVSCSLSDNQKWIVIRVKDSGIGISPDDQSVIFERFRKIEKSNTTLYRGTGLGLSISKQLANLLGGDIEVTSEVGKGSVFQVTLPAIAGNVASPQSTPEKATLPALNLKGKHILVVEDNPSNALLVSLYLKDSGATVINAANGFEALQVFIKKQYVDLVLMDLQMPVMDGFESFKEIKKVEPSALIVAQTAYSFEDEKNKALAAGFTDLISKPLRKDDLFKLLQKYLT